MVNKELPKTLLEINNLIITAASTSLGITKHIKNQKSTLCWNENCNQAIKKNTKASNFYKRHKTEERTNRIEEKRGHMQN